MSDFAETILADCGLIEPIEPAPAVVLNAVAERHRQTAIKALDLAAANIAIIQANLEYTPAADHVFEACATALMRYLREAGEAVEVMRDTCDCAGVA